VAVIVYREFWRRGPLVGGALRFSRWGFDASGALITCKLFLDFWSFCDGARAIPLSASNYRNFIEYDFLFLFLFFFSVVFFSRYQRCYITTK
jgi:hypothetical protein